MPSGFISFAELNKQAAAQTPGSSKLTLSPDEMAEFVPVNPITEEEPNTSVPADPGKKSGFVDSMIRGGGNILATTGSAARDLGIPGARGLEQLGDKIVSEHAASINTLSDMVSDPGQTIKEGVAEALPQGGVTLAGAGTGALAGGAIGSVVPVVGTAAGATVGGLIGAFAPNALQSYGGIRKTQRAEGTDDKLKAAGGAIVSGAIDMLGPEASVPRQIVTGGLKKLGTASTMDLLKKTGKDVAKEGATEAAQSVVERYAAGQELTGQEAIDDYAVSAGKGAAGGGAFSVGGSVAGNRARGKQIEAERQITEQQESEAAAAAHARNISEAKKQGGAATSNPNYRTPTTAREDLFAVDTLPDLDTVMSKGIRVVETGDKPDRVSEAGAVGAHQLLPSTAKAMAAKLGLKYDEARLLKDPKYNGQLAKAYMETLADRYNGDMFKAVTAYHAGEGNVDSWIKRFGDPNQIGHEAWLQKIEKAGNPRSANYPRKVFAALGRGLEFSATPTESAWAWGDDRDTRIAKSKAGLIPEGFEPEDWDAQVSQGSIFKALVGATLDESGTATMKPKALLGLSGKLSNKLKNADIEGANDVLAAERGKLEQQLADLAEEQQALTDAADQHTAEQQAKFQADLDARFATLTRKEAVYNTADQLIGAVQESLGATQQDLFAEPAAPAVQEPVAEAPAAPPINIVTEPGPAPDLQVQETPPVTPAASTVLADQLRGETDAANQEAAVAATEPLAAVTKARAQVLDKVLNDAETRNPTRRYTAELRKLGLDASLSAEEAERIARFEDVKAGFNQPVTRDEGSPDESGNFGIPERQEPKAPEAPTPAAAEAAPAPKVDAPTNIRTRADARADTLGSSRRAWFLKGVDHELGVADTPVPASKSKATWFEEGRAFAREEKAHQDRESGAEPKADRRADSGPAVLDAVADVPKAKPVAAKPAPAPKQTVGDQIKAKVKAEREATPEPKADDRPKTRGTKSKFNEAVAKAEQDGKLSARDGMVLRAMADADWDESNWDAFDEAVKGSAHKSTGKAKTGQLLPDLKAAEAKLRAELDRMGLSDIASGVATKFEIYSAVKDEDFKNVEGAYLPKENWANGTGKGLIFVALDGVDASTTAQHEAIHAMRDLDLFTPAEWAAMAKYAGAQADVQKFVEEGYSENSIAKQIEESIAESYARWTKDQGSLPGLARRGFTKIKNFLTAIKRVLTGQGFKSAEDIFRPEAVAIYRKIFTGDIGSRPRPEETRVARRIREAETNALIESAGWARKGVGKADAAIRTSAMDFAKKSWLWVTSVRDIAQAARTLLPSAERFVEANSRGHALARQFEDRLADIKRAYEDLPQNVKGSGKGTINDLLDDMTAQQKWAYKPEWNAKAVVDPEMAARFNRLPTAAQNVVKAIFSFNHEAREQLAAATVKAIEAEYNPLIDAATDDAARKKLEKEKRDQLGRYSRQFDTREDVPYSPRSRSGDFVAVGMSPEFMAAKEANDTVAMDKMRSDPKHYWVQFYDSLGQAKATAEKLQGKHYAHTDHFQRDQDGSILKLGGKDMHLAFNQLRSKLQKNLRDDPNDSAAKALYQLATDLYLHALTDNSARKAEMRSHRVAGKDPITGEAIDMMGSFLSRGQATAHFVATLSNTKEVYDALEALNSEAEAHSGKNNDDRANAQRFKNELLWHYVNNLNRQPSRFVERVLRLNSIQTLLTKPGYHFQNATQTWLLTLPQLAAETNYVKAAREVNRAYGEVLPLIKHWTSDRLDIRKIKNDELRSVAQNLQDRGFLGTGLSMELGDWQLNGNGLLPKLWNPIDTALRQIPQNIEDVNRLVAGFAAYRTKLSKGASKADALEYAGKVIAETHGDYTHFNTPRVMKGHELMRIPMQYRKFQLIMAALNVKMVHRMLDKGLTPQQRRVAMKAFAFTMAHMVAIAGVRGLPGVALIASLTMFLLGKDDDEWKEDLEDSLTGFFGKDHPMVGLLAKGAPYEYLKTDLSNTLGMGTIFNAAPFVDMPKLGSDKEGFMATVGQLATGSLGGTAYNMFQGAGFLRDGDVERAAEMFMPSGISNALKGIRYGKEGYTAKNGDVLLTPDDITLLDQLYTALSLPSANLADFQERRSIQFDTEERFKEKTTSLRRRYTKAAKEKDTAEMAKVREDWKEMQDERREKGLRVQPLSNLLRAPRDQMKRERKTEGGLQYNAANRRLVQMLNDQEDEED